MSARILPHLNLSGFFHIPGSDGYYISRDAVILNSRDEKVAIFRSTGSGKLTASIRFNGERSNKQLDYLIGLTFCPLPNNVELMLLRILHLDGNDENNDPHNLLWVRKEALRGFDREIENKRVKEEYNWPIFHSKNTGLFPEAIECKKHGKGWYYVPGADTPLLANPSGAIYNLVLGKLQNVYNVGDYQAVSISYNSVSNNKYVHRIIARMFVGKPDRHADKDYADLEVNHKDGVKSNNAATNLEWVTPSENLLHAVQNKLKTPYNLGTGNKDRLKRKDFNILAKDVRNGKIKQYTTISELCKEHGLNDQLIVVRLNNGQAPIKTKDWHVFKYDDGTEWPELKDYQKVPSRWHISGSAWYATKEGQPVLYGGKAADIEGALGWRHGRIGVQFARNGKDALIDGWKVVVDHDPDLETAERLALNKSGIRDAIKLEVRLAYGLTSMQPVCYDSIAKAASESGVSTATLAKAIKQNGLEKFIIGNYEFQAKQ